MKFRILLTLLTLLALPSFAQQNMSDVRKDRIEETVKNASSLLDLDNDVTIRGNATFLGGTTGISVTGLAISEESVTGTTPTTATLATGSHYIYDMSGATGDTTVTLQAGASNATVRVSITENTGDYALIIAGNGAETILYGATQYDDGRLQNVTGWVHFVWDADNSYWVADDNATFYSGNFNGDLSVTGTLGVGTDSPSGQAEIYKSNVSTTHTYFYLTNEAASFDKAGSQAIFAVSKDVGTSVADNDMIGGVYFNMTDTSGNMDTGAMIRGRVDGTPGANVPTELLFNTHNGTSNDTRLLISASGATELTVRTDGSGGVGTVFSGTYTPTFPTESCVGSVLANGSATYSRVGNQVTVNGATTIDCSSGGDFTMTLPVSTTFGSCDECLGGTGGAYETSSNDYLAIRADTSSGTRATFRCTGACAGQYYFHFSYRVL